MLEYEKLYSKLQNNTITQLEKQRLFQLAFGNKFMENKNPNKKWKVQG